MNIVWLAVPVATPQGGHLTPGWIDLAAFPWVPEEKLDRTRVYAPSRPERIADVWDPNIWLAVKKTRQEMLEMYPEDE